MNDPFVGMLIEEPCEALKEKCVLGMVSIHEDALNRLEQHAAYEANHTRTITRSDELKPAWDPGSIVICELTEAPVMMFSQQCLTPRTLVVPHLHLTWVLRTLHKYKAHAFDLLVTEFALSDIPTHDAVKTSRYIKERIKKHHSQTCTLLLHLHHVGKGLESGD